MATCYCFETMVRLGVVAHPGARQERVELVKDDVLAVWVPARAIEGQANAAIERAVARALGLRMRQVHLLAGQKARHKIVELDVDSLDSVRTRLMAHGVRPG